MNNTVRISSRCDRLATFKDLALFIEEQATISNSVFGLKLFAQSSTKTEQSKNLAKSDQSRGIARSDQPKRTKATSAFNTLTSIETKPAVPRKCLHCAKSHYIYHCPQFRSLAYAKKRDVVKKHSLCWVCLNPGHFAATSTSGLLCKKQRCGSSSHNTILHPPEYTEKQSKVIRGLVLNQTLSKSVARQIVRLRNLLPLLAPLLLGRTVEMVLIWTLSR